MKMPLHSYYSCCCFFFFFACNFLLFASTNQNIHGTQFQQRVITVNTTSHNTPANTANSSTSAYYTAGVVEFRPSAGAVNSLQDNLAAYLAIIESADAADTDIIVFPESTLNGKSTATEVPDPETTLDDNVRVPCLHVNDSENASTDSLLVALSCGARRTRKYLVINLTEKENCTSTSSSPLLASSLARPSRSSSTSRPCAADGLNIYNTNVVFDREGRVVSRYRKWNLYGEPRNTTATVELGFFDTDFGVRFGHFICFDILFYAPPQLLVELGITDFAFPSMWYSQLPFLTAVQFQQSWSYANDVNFLAAGASRPAVGSTGTGIYAGRKGALIAVMKQGEGERRLYKARVPKRKTAKQQTAQRLRLSTTAAAPQRLNQAQIRLKRDYLDQYVSEPIDLSSSNTTGRQQLKRELCYQSFCCHFALEWHTLTFSSATSQYYTYRLGVYEGMRDEPGAEATNALRNCAIFTCLGPEITDCGKSFGAEVLQEPRIAFDRIVLEADLQRPGCYHQAPLVMPNSLRDDLLPLRPSEFMWEERVNVDGSLHIRYTLNTTTSNLLAFAIYGNYFEGSEFMSEPGTDAPSCDDPLNAGNGASTVLVSLVLLCCLVVLVNKIIK